MPPSRRRAAAALRSSSGALSTAATGRMSSDLPWFDDLSAEDRSWVGLIVQAGIRGFVDWYDLEDESGDPDPLAVAVFGAAPRELTGVISLQQTVELVRLSIRVIETNIDDLIHPDDLGAVHDAVLRYAREVAFATAAVYARAAESRGAWDARLEALVVDAVVRAEADETVLSRASALGWGAHGDVAVVLGAVPPHRAELDVFESIRRSARAGDMDALCATQGDRLVVVLGGVREPLKAATRLIDHFGDGPVVVGPVTADLAHAHASARAALLGPPGRERLAGRAPTRDEPRPAPRARAGRRRPRAAPPRRRGLPAAVRRPRHPAGDPGRRGSSTGPRSRPPAAPSSCTPTRCATACGRSPT